MSFAKALISFLHPHYIINIFLGISYYILKTTEPFCSYLFDDCELELREWEMLTFLGCIIVMKNRKQPSYRMYIGTVCMFAKILGVIMFYRQNPLFSIIYAIFCLVHLAFFPEPAYSGPEEITYFNGKSLEEELERDKRITWVITFYTAWSPNCTGFAPIFSQISHKYSLDNLKFGKVDVNRNPEVAERYKISTSSWTKQLPTVILFREGSEVQRRPMIDKRQSVIRKFVFSEDNVVRELGINEIYLQNKKSPLNKKKEKASTKNKDD